MEDKKPKELTKNDKETLRTGNEAKAFLESPFGKFYIQILKAALENKRREYEKPAESGPMLDGVSQILRAESAKGAIMGIRLALDTLDGMVSAANALRAQKGLSETAEEES